MERVYAFTDEYGAFGWDIENPTVSTHFIISAIIVKESDLESFNITAEAIRKHFFQTSEIKSSKVGGKHVRRQAILSEIMKLPFQIFSVCIDKKSCMENMNSKGIQYKQTFYKFMNNIVHKELRRAFKKITIIADQVGSNDYMESFCKYVEKQSDVPNLLGEAEFYFKQSDNDIGIQIADFISGTLAYIYDNHKNSGEIPDYYHQLEPNIIRIEQYPKTYRNFVLETSAIAEDYDKEIAEICYRQAALFIENNSNSSDPEVAAQVLVLQYLLFRFMNNSTRGYIYTQELKRQLQNTDLRDISESTFRMRIIGKLRDKGVIIASSNKGYKLPSKLSEIYDFINHDARIVIPMLDRLKKCRDLVRLSTNNNLDLLDQPEYNRLKEIFDRETI